VRRLLIRPGAIGDIILSLPTLEAARADYTEVWAPRPILPLIRFADRTRAIIDTGIDRMGVVPNASVPALETFDSIYSWYGTQNPDFRDAVAHLPFTFLPALPPPADGIPRIPVPSLPQLDHIVIHPFASSPRKRWPIEQFQDLAASLPIPVRWLAGPEEALEGAQRIEDLYELACWVAQARLYIGNDSGVSHLAAAVGTPTLAIFLTTDPAIWAPRGAHVRVLLQPTVGAVLTAALQALR
jgi:heptosyltransferase III